MPVAAVRRLPRAQYRRTRPGLMLIAAGLRTEHKAEKGNYTTSKAIHTRDRSILTPLVGSFCKPDAIRRPAATAYVTSYLSV